MTDSRRVATFAISVMGQRAEGGLRADTNFAAAFAEGKDLTWVEPTIGIEGVVHTAHEIEVGVGEEERHEFGLLHSDTVLAGKRTTHFNTVADDFGGNLQGAF